jgi:hypothetical protein
VEGSDTRGGYGPICERDRVCEWVSREVVEVKLFFGNKLHHNHHHVPEGLGEFPVP